MLKLPFLGNASFSDSFRIHVRGRSWSSMFEMTGCMHDLLAATAVPQFITGREGSHEQDRDVKGC